MQFLGNTLNFDLIKLYELCVRHAKDLDLDSTSQYKEKLRIVYVCVCVRACVRACVYVRACVCVCVCV